MTELTEEELEALLNELGRATEEQVIAFTDAVYGHFREHSYSITLGTYLFMGLIRRITDTWYTVAAEAIKGEKPE